MNLLPAGSRESPGSLELARALENISSSEPLTLAPSTLDAVKAPYLSLGQFYFAAGTQGSVKISNSGTNGYVVADAIMLRLVPQ